MCDKGVPSALVMAMTRSMVRPEAMRLGAPYQVLHAVNQHLLDMNDSGLFVTVLYGILDQATGEFSYVRAAHEVPILLNNQGEPIATQRGPGQPLGIFDEPEMEAQTLVIPPGGTLLLHSDGVSDALDPQGVAFGYARLREAVRAYRELPAQTICDRLIDDLTQYRGSVPQHDDITLLAVQRS
jgi:phosphoserine phosphatase RsbU/P